MRVLMLLACGSLLMRSGYVGPRSRISGTASRDAFERPDRDWQLTQALAHHGRGLLHAGAMPTYWMRRCRLDPDTVGHLRERGATAPMPPADGAAE